MLFIPFILCFLAWKEYILLVHSSFLQELRGKLRSLLETLKKLFILLNGIDDFLFFFNKVQNSSIFPKTRKQKRVYREYLKPGPKKKNPSWPYFWILPLLNQPPSPHVSVWKIKLEDEKKESEILQNKRYHNESGDDFHNLKVFFFLSSCSSLLELGFGLLTNLPYSIKEIIIN